MKWLSADRRKKLLILCCIFSATGIDAQKCLDINIVTLMAKLETPGNAASSFNKCQTSKNEQRQTIIIQYGSDLVALDTLEARTAREFTYAVVGSTDYGSMHAPSQQQVADIQADAEKLKSMTPDQQKAYAMQMSQKYNTPSAKPASDDPATMQLVMKAQNTAIVQLKALDDEFAEKILAADKSASAEIHAIPRPDKSGCPQNKQGMIACSCSNQAEAVYWKKVVAVQDQYNNQKISIYLSYLPRIKALAGTVDDIVVQCGYGASLRSAEMKKMLLRSQSAAFANAMVEATLCIEGIRKSGSDYYVNKVNSDMGVYDISCFR